MSDHLLLGENNAFVFTFKNNNNLKKHLDVWFLLKHVVSEGENLPLFLCLDFTINCLLPKVKYRKG